MYMERLVYDEFSTTPLFFPQNCTRHRGHGAYYLLVGARIAVGCVVLFINQSVKTRAAREERKKKRGEIEDANFALLRIER